MLLNPQIIQAQTKKHTLKISGMHCASCTAKIEAAVKKVKGVSDVSVNFASEKATILCDDKKSTQKEIEKTIENLGYRVVKKEDNVLHLRIVGMDNPHCLGTIDKGL